MVNLEKDFIGKGRIGSDQNSEFRQEFNKIYHPNKDSSLHVELMKEILMEGLCQ